jgi:hypothetical protein
VKLIKKYNKSARASGINISKPLNTYYINLILIKKNLINRATGGGLKRASVAIKARGFNYYILINDLFIINKINI